MSLINPAAPTFLDKLCTDPDYLNRYLRDPRIYVGSTKNKTAYEVLMMIEDVKKIIPDFDLPFVCLHGSEDQCALAKGTELFYRLSRTDEKKKRDVYHARLIS